MKTAVIFNEVETLRYAVVDDDWTRFHDVYINAIDTDSKLATDLSELVWYSGGDDIDPGGERLQFCELSEFAQSIRDGAFVVECGFLP